LARDMAADTGWLEPAFYEAGEDQGFGISILHAEPGNGLFVETVSWLPGRGVAPHDHQTWGVVVGLDGSEANVTWRRLDDGTQAGYAEVEKAEEAMVEWGHVVTLLPHDIHSVHNDGADTSLSLHIYGRNLATVERSEFDPLAKTVRPCPKRQRTAVA
jgi:predicted metal-dependent enzyme (double-stranded beta helix superfamily)